MNRILYPLLALSMIASPALAQDVTRHEANELSERKMRDLLALTPGTVADMVTIEDDELEPLAIITTQDVFRSRGRFSDPVRTDNILRAIIHKASGEVTIQLYQKVTYPGDWRRFESVSYLAEGAPTSSPLTIIARDVVTCDYGPCVVREEVAFQLHRSLLEEIASGYTAGSSRLWRYRLRAQNGLDWQDQIAPAEVAGLLLAVDRYIGEE